MFVLAGFVQIAVTGGTERNQILFAVVPALAPGHPMMYL
jgi:hypothetical protein